MVKFMETERRMVVPGAEGRGDGEFVFNGYRVPVGEVEGF